MDRDDFAKLRPQDCVLVCVGMNKYRALVDRVDTERDLCSVHLGSCEVYGSGPTHSLGSYFDVNRVTSQIELAAEQPDDGNWWRKPEDWTDWRSVLDFMHGQGCDFGQLRRSLEKPWNYAAEAWAVKLIN